MFQCIEKLIIIDCRFTKWRLPPLRYCALLLVLLWWPCKAFSHDIPSSITLYLYIKPEAEKVNVLMRVPMEALSEIDFPKRGPGYLDFPRLNPAMEEAARFYLSESFQIFENGRELTDPTIEAVRVDMPSDRSFTEYRTAIGNLRAPPLNNDTDLFWAQGVFDLLVTYPIESPQSDFAFESVLDQLSEETTTVLRFILPDGGERVFNYTGNPGLVDLDPGFFSALGRFVVLGFEHILDGLDHLLFLFCLVIPLRRLGALVPVITSFTIAHSITLISSAFGLVPNVMWFAPLIETLIALSIVYMACENILGVDLKNRWLITFFFGLVHGFGFSFVLSDTMQFAGTHLFSSLLAFNVGVELGQLFVLLLAIPALNLFFRVVKVERVGTILLSAFVAHEAWHWMTERGSEFFQYEIQAPVLNAAFFAGLMRWGMLLVVIAVIVWLLLQLFNRFASINTAAK